MSDAAEQLNARRRAIPISERDLLLGYHQTFRDFLNFLSNILAPTLQAQNVAISKDSRWSELGDMFQAKCFNPGIKTVPDNCV
jgi:hypothetical protein